MIDSEVKANDKDLSELKLLTAKEGLSVVLVYGIFQLCKTESPKQRLRD
jgi:hypothetical protein